MQKENSESDDVSKKEKKETGKKSVQSNKKDLLTKLRDNPWMLASVILGILFVGSMFMSSGAPTVSEKKISGKVLDFLNAQVGGGIVLNSVTKNNDYYELEVSYQGQALPVYASLSGDYLYAEIIPLGDVPSGNSGTDNSDSGGFLEIELGDSPMKGDVNAPVTIVEFTDYECPFCSRFYAETYPLLVQNYISTGKAKFVVKDFPLGFHPDAQKAAEAARCFDEQGDYFDMHDKIYENQRNLDVDSLKQYAKDLGANAAEFDSCLDSGKYASVVQEDAAYGASLGVTGTPAFFINGKLLTGAQPYSVFEDFIEAELA
jgi:predicted DsbA family dithiol-disulfide isomerase